MNTRTIRRILVPVDFSSCSRAALELACSLGAALDATLDVLFVGPLGDGDGRSAFSPKERDAAKEELHRFVGAVQPLGSLKIAERVETGDARERIVAIAERDGFDLIVLGTHGRTGRPRSLAGSVAESVVRTSSRPVVTVRE
jgi:nucleotide-binding universal stress UspA family protein